MFKHYRVLCPAEYDFKNVREILKPSGYYHMYM